MNDAAAAKNIAMLTASGDLPIAPLYGKTAQSPSRSRQCARIERRASVEHRAPGSNTHTERLIKTAEDPLHERIPRSFAFFCGLRNISFCRPVFKAAADTKGLVIRAFYISHPKNAFAPTQYAVWRCPWARCPTRAAAHDVYSASAGASSGRYPENPRPSIAPISAISSGEISKSNT